MHLMWWLILRVSLTGPRGGQIKHYFLVCVCKDVSGWDWISGLPKANCLPQSGWALSSSLRNRIKSRGRKDSPHPHPFLPTWAETLVLRTLDSDWNDTTGSRVCGLWREGCGLLSLHNHTNQFPSWIAYIHIDSVSLETHDSYTWVH